MIAKKDFQKISPYLWEIPKTFNPHMFVPARIYATKKLLEQILSDRTIQQLINVACLPGIQKYSLAMPDAHEGYGFPIGGVAAFAEDNGIISPGGIGYDINCGVRLLASNLTHTDIKKDLRKLIHELYQAIPTGIGQGGNHKFKGADLDKILALGSKKIIELGYGNKHDLENTESEGCIIEADPKNVSAKAKMRAYDQCGSLGAGNHFIEIDIVASILDSSSAQKFGLFQNQIVIQFHTGSRGLGHQIATDYIENFLKASSKYKIFLPDKELAAVPFLSPLGQAYFSAMAAGANFAWANRQLLTDGIRKVWKKIFNNPNESEIRLIYDVAHNIAKREEYNIDGITKKVIVHRKGATRAFLNQPVLIPGSMGTGSYLLIGQNQALTDTFGSTCHGAGRLLSRTAARRQINGLKLKNDLEQNQIMVETGSLSGLAEEAPAAYKDIHEVIEVVSQANIAKKVAFLKPIAVIKG